MWNVCSNLIRDEKTAKRLGGKVGGINPDLDPQIIARVGTEEEAIRLVEQERADGAELAYHEWEG